LFSEQLTPEQELKELKKRQAAEDLRANVLALFPFQQIKVKTSGDVLLVTLMRVLEIHRQVEVRQADG